MTSPSSSHGKAPPEFVVPPPDLRIPRAPRSSIRWDGKRGGGTRRARSRGRMHNGPYAAHRYMNNNTHRNTNSSPAISLAAPTSLQPPTQTAHQVVRDPRRRPEHLRRRMEESVKPSAAPTALLTSPKPSAPLAGQPSASPSPPVSLSAFLRSMPSPKETKHSRINRFATENDTNVHPPSLGAMASSSSVADAFDPPPSISSPVNKPQAGTTSKLVVNNLKLAIISSPAPKPDQPTSLGVQSTSVPIPKSQPAPSTSRLLTHPSTTASPTEEMGVSSPMRNSTTRPSALAFTPLKKQTPLQRMAAQSKAKAAAAANTSSRASGSKPTQLLSDGAAAKMQRDLRLLTRRASTPTGGIQPPPRKTDVQRSLPESYPKKSVDGIAKPISKTAKIVANRAHTMVTSNAAGRPIPPPPKKAKSFVTPHNIQPTQTSIASPTPNSQTVRAKAIAPRGPDMNSNASINPANGPNPTTFVRPALLKPGIKQTHRAPEMTPPKSTSAPSSNQVMLGPGIQLKKIASHPHQNYQASNSVSPGGQMRASVRQNNQSVEVPRITRSETHSTFNLIRNGVHVSTMQTHFGVSNHTQNAAVPKPSSGQAAIVTPIVQAMTSVQRSESSVRASTQLRTPHGTFARDPNAPPKPKPKKTNPGSKWQPAVRYLVPSQAERLRLPENVQQPVGAQIPSRVQQTPRLQQTPRVQQTARVLQRPRLQTTRRVWRGPRIYHAPPTQQHPLVPQIERASDIAARFERDRQQNSVRPGFTAPKETSLAPSGAVPQQSRVVQTGQPPRQVFGKQPVIIRHGPSRNVLPGRQSMPGIPAVRRIPAGSQQRRASVPPTASQYVPGVNVTRPPPTPLNPPSLPTAGFAGNKSPNPATSSQIRIAMDAATIGYSQLANVVALGQRPTVIKKFSAPKAPSTSKPAAIPVAKLPSKDPKTASHNSAFDKFLARRGKKRGWEADSNDSNADQAHNTISIFDAPVSNGMEPASKRRKTDLSYAALEGPNIASRRGSYTLVRNDFLAELMDKSRRLELQSPKKLSWNIPSERDVRPGSARTVIYEKRTSVPVSSRNAISISAPPPPRPALPFRPQTRTPTRTGHLPRPISIPTNTQQQISNLNRTITNTQPRAVLSNKSNRKATPIVPATSMTRNAPNSVNGINSPANLPVAMPTPGTGTAALLAVSNANIPKIASPASLAMTRPVVRNVPIPVPIAVKRSGNVISFTGGSNATKRTPIQNSLVNSLLASSKPKSSNGTAASTPAGSSQAKLKPMVQVTRIGAPKPPVITLEMARKEREARAKQATKHLRVGAFVEEIVVDGNKYLCDASFDKIPADMQAVIERKTAGWASPIGLWKWKLAVHDDYLGKSGAKLGNQSERTKQLKELKDLPFDAFIDSCMG